MKRLSETNKVFRLWRWLLAGITVLGAFLSARAWIKAREDAEWNRHVAFARGEMERTGLMKGTDYDRCIAIGKAITARGGVVTDSEMREVFTKSHGPSVSSDAMWLGTLFIYVKKFTPFQETEIRSFVKSEMQERKPGMYEIGVCRLGMRLKDPASFDRLKDIAENGDAASSRVAKLIIEEHARRPKS